jgi:hypothetical protein
MSTILNTCGIKSSLYNNPNNPSNLKEQYLLPVAIHVSMPIESNLLIIEAAALFMSPLIPL